MDEDKDLYRKDRERKGNSSRKVDKDLIVYELIGKAYYQISKENTFKLNKFKAFKSFAESKKCTVDEIMKDILISFSPIEEGWDSEGCVEPIIDNGFGIYYGYHHKA